jgi:hypothetical protein
VRLFPAGTTARIWLDSNKLRLTGMTFPAISCSKMEQPTKIVIP